jgi:hypothetical protein
MNDSEGFLARWSRRKRAAAAPPPEPELIAPTEAVPAEPAAEFDPASLPPIESLTAESDISCFLRPQVPAALRSAALRRVWTLDPVIRDYVGPADYAWDYNAPDGIPGFSLDLGGDVKRLLAQAIGLVEEEEKPAPAAATEPGPVVLAEVPAEPVQPAEALAPPQGAPPAEPPGLAAEAAAAPLPVRRHGGARPV